MEDRINELEADIETLLKLWVGIGEANETTWVSVRKSVSEIGARVRRLGMKEKMKLIPHAKAESLCKTIESFSERYELLTPEKVNYQIFGMDKEVIEKALLKRIDWSRNRLYASFN